MIRCAGAWGGGRAEEISSLGGEEDGMLRYSGRGDGGTVERSGRRLCGWKEPGGRFVQVHSGGVCPCSRY